MLVLFNAHHDDIPFSLPPTRSGQKWERLIDTARPSALAVKAPVPYPLTGRSVAVFRTRVTARVTGSWRSPGR